MESDQTTFSKEVYLFDAVRFVPSRNEVEVNGIKITLEPRLSKLLHVLCQASGETITRDEIMDQVWGDVIVSDVSLTRGISDLRKILRDDIQDPRIIKTVRKIGYRMLVQATLTELPSPSVSIKAARRIYGWSAVALLIAVALIWQLWPKPVPQRPQELEPVAVTTANEGGASVSRQGDVAYVIAHADRTDLVVWAAKSKQKITIFSWRAKIWATQWDRSASSIYVCADHDAGLAIYKVFPVSGAEPVLFMTLPYTITMGMAALDNDNLIISVGSASEPFRLLKLGLRDKGSEPFVDAPVGCVGAVYPCVSPNGQRILYSIAESYHRFTVFVCDVDGRNRVSVSAPNVSIYDLEWLSDTDIGYIATIEHKPYLYTKSFEAAALFESVIDLGSFASSLSVFDPYLVVENTHTDSDIVLFNKQSGQRRVTDSVLVETDGHYAPKRREVTYVSNENNHYQVFICGIDGTNKRVISPQTGRHGSPRWSHAEDQVAFIDRLGGPTKVYVYNLEQESTQEIVSNLAIDNISGFSLDDRELFVRMRDGDWSGVVGMDMNGVVTRRIKDAWKCVQLPDQSIVYNRLDEFSIWLLDEGEPLRIAETSAHVGSSWDVIGNHLFYIGVDYQLNELDLLSGEILFSQALSQSPFAIGNLSVVDEQTVCFDHVKSFHGDIYFGQLKSRLTSK